jgi:hypothetical protein
MDCLYQGDAGLSTTVSINEGKMVGLSGAYVLTLADGRSL